MTKCDFCTKSTPDKKCLLYLEFYKERYCEKAIKSMTEALKSIGVNSLKI